MHKLRHAHWITRLVLVWFVLFIGASVASPLIKQDQSQMVCSATGGMKMVSSDSGNDAHPAPHTGMDCPLCMPFAAPAAATLPLATPSGLAHGLPPIESPRWASLIAPPWQARAPPLP